MLDADYVFGTAVALIVASNLYLGPSIKSDHIAMQWGFDGKPTWYAPKYWAMWLVPLSLLGIRVFIWLIPAYEPLRVHGVETAIILSSVVLAAVHIFILKMAQKAD